MASENAPNALVSAATILLAFGFLIAWIASLAWVYNDAEGRGKSGCLWLLIALFTWPLGVVAYAVLRDREVRL